MTPAFYYKYTKHSLETLQELQLKVTPPNALNDPFEFRPSIQAEMTRKKIEQLLQNDAELRKLHAQWRKEGCVWDFNEFTRQIKRDRESFIALILDGFQPKLAEYRRSYQDEVSKQFGVLCLSANCSSILMWSHYADSHKGAVLALDAKHSFFQDHAFDPVEYSDEKVFLDPTWDEQSKERQSYNRDVIRRKSVQWKYEDEIRALYRLDTCNKTIIGESTLYFVKIPAELFKKVVFGAKCSAGYREKVKSLAIQQKLNVQFEEVVLHEDQSELRFRPM